MLKIVVVMLVFAFCLASLGACGKDGGGTLSDDQAIDIAAHHLIGKSFDSNPPATVAHADGKYTVVFTRPVPGGAPGDVYHSKVVFDEKTHEALEIAIEAEESPQTHAPAVAPAGPDYRPTPLNEEVDAVDALQKQLGKLSAPQ